MSNYNKNLHGISAADRTNSKITDVGMSVAPKKDNNNKRKIISEELFDSGILSENFSSTDQFLSEEIIGADQYSSSGEGKKEIRDQSVDENFRKQQSDKELMTLDSGIDIEVSDQFSSSSNNVVLDENLTVIKNVRRNLSSSTTNTFSSTELFSSSQSKFDDKYDSLQENSSESTSEQFPSWRLYFIQDDDGNTQLHIALIEGYLIAAANLIRLVPDSRYLDIRNDYCQTGLHLAVLTNQPQLVRQLVLSGARTNIVDQFGNTALHLACKSNHLDCVKALLDPATKQELIQHRLLQYTPILDFPYKYINEYNYTGMACVHLAANVKNLLILHQLLIHGADVNIRECSNGYTILHEAVICGNERLVCFILQHKGIDLEKQSYARLTPYQLSCSKYPNIRKLLSEKGAKSLSFLEDVEDESDEDEEEDQTYVLKNFLQGPSVVVTTC